MRAPSRSIRLIVVCACVALMPRFAVPAAHDTPHWSYSGSSGPTHWATLEEDYNTCGVGTTQSPIDIRDDVAKKADLPAINFDYKASTLKIINNGHTIQINYTPGSSITVGGTSSTEIRRASSRSLPCCSRRPAPIR